MQLYDENIFIPATPKELNPVWDSQLPNFLSTKSLLFIKRTIFHEYACVAVSPITVLVLLTIVY